MWVSYTRYKTCRLECTGWSRRVSGHRPGRGGVHTRRLPAHARRPQNEHSRCSFSGCRARMSSCTRRLMACTRGVQLRMMALQRTSTKIARRMHDNHRMSTLSAHSVVVMHVYAHVGGRASARETRVAFTDRMTDRCAQTTRNEHPKCSFRASCAQTVARVEEAHRQETDRRAQKARNEHLKCSFRASCAPMAVRR
jgi:hypothetical protein